MLNENPLNTETYPEELLEEVRSSCQAVLNADPLPAGEAPEPLFETQGVKRPLPSLRSALVGVSGKPHSGKDVFAEFMQAYYRRVARMNFSDPIIDEVNRWLACYGRRITQANKSHPLHRHLLQVWGRARRYEGEGYWVAKLRESIVEAEKDSDLIIVAGVRAVSDLELIEEMGGVCLRVNRPGNPYQAEDPIESALDRHQDRMIALLNPAENDLEPYIANIEACVHGRLANPGRALATNLTGA